MARGLRHEKGENKLPGEVKTRGSFSGTFMAESQCPGLVRAKAMYEGMEVMSHVGRRC